MKNEKAKKVFSVIFTVLLIAVLSLLILNDIVNKNMKETDKLSVAMGTVITQKLFAENDAFNECEEIENIINALEDKISWRKEGTDVYTLNETGVLKCDKEMKDIIARSNDIYASCDAFDITVGKLTSLWNIGQEDAYLPSEKEISEALEFVDGSEVKISGDTVTLKKGQCIDLGAVGKGLACDKIKEYLEETDISEAVISVGGSVLLYSKDPKSGERVVAVRDPRDDSDVYMGTLSLHNCCVSTSGDYERVFNKDGKTYHHIIDPDTGYPAQSGLISVTIVSESGFLSDALSTACFVLGMPESIALLEKYNAQGVFIDSSYNVYVTKGLSEKFKLTSDKYVLSGEIQ